MSVRPQVSVVLPSYRSAALARRSVAALQEFLPAHFASWEVLVVDDGSGDLEGEPARTSAGGRVAFLRLASNRGKGAAVRRGMRAARGAVRVFTDIDLPYELDVLPRAVAAIDGGGAHVVIGDRTLAGSSYTLRVGWRRKLASAVFSRIVRAVLTADVADTQCGFKAFRGDVAEALFAESRIDRYAFDVELIHLAQRARARIEHVPVVLRNNETSAVRLLRDSSRMLFDVARVRLHEALGRYRSDALAAMVRGDAAAARGADPAAPAPLGLVAANRASGGA